LSLAAQTWTTDWQGHGIEVEYRADIVNDQAECRLRIDGQIAQEDASQLAIPWHGSALCGQIVAHGGPCRHADCRHENPPDARFCARCGRENEHTLPVRVELKRTLLRVTCRILVGDACVLDSAS